MKITIVITDTPDGKCNLSFDFDPPIDQEDRVGTQASRFALRILENLANDMKVGHIDEPDDITSEPEPHES